jgi:hypothetical protein
MKATGLLAFVLLLGPVLQTPVPRRVRQGEQADAQAQRDIPPPLQKAISVSASPLLAQSGRPIPPGIRKADQVDAQMDRNMPPPTQKQRSVNPITLKHEADELAALAQSIPSAVDQTTKGMIPKDLAEKLKRIEKLAKHIRGQLTP